MQHITQKIAIAYIIFIMCITLPVFVDDEPVEAATYWDGPDGFVKCRTLGLNAQFAGYVSNITVWSTAGHDSFNNQSVSAFGCRSDFGDIRFYRPDEETALDYWLQIKNESAGWATFWVNNSYNDTEINMFYDNDAAGISTTSNGTNTFWQWINTTTAYIVSKPDPGWYFYSGAPSSTSVFYNATGTMYYEDISNSYAYRAAINFSDCLDPLWTSCGVTVEADINETNTFVDSNRFNIYVSDHNSFMDENVHANIDHQKSGGTNDNYFIYTDNEVSEFICNDTAGEGGLKYTHGYDSTKMWRIDHNMNLNISNYWIFNLTYNNSRPFANPSTNETLWEAKLNLTPNLKGYGTPPIPEYLTLSGSSTTTKGGKATFTNAIRMRPFRMKPPKFDSFSGVYDIVGRFEPRTTSNVEETTATLNAIILNDSGFSCLTGFYLGTTNVTNTSWDWNISVGYFDETDRTYAYNMTGLQQGEYYFLKTWGYNGTGWYTSHETEYFLTKPYSISNFRASTSSPTTVSLSWINPAVGAGTNLTVSLYYNKTNVITDRDDGTFIANYTESAGGSFHKVTGLSDNSSYYFTAFTSVNASGSPYLYQDADEQAWTQIDTTLGVFNVTVYNETNCTNTVNLAQHGPHRITVVYNNKTEVNIITGGAFTRQETDMDWSNLDAGQFTINCTYTPLYMEIHWNQTDNATYQCRRKTLFHDNDNISMFLVVDHPVYGVSTLRYVNETPTLYLQLDNETLIPYTYNFVDTTGLYSILGNIDVYATIYTYNCTGDLRVIHEEFLDASGRIYPWLIYGNEYFVGITSSTQDFRRLGITPSANDLSPYVYIKPSSDADEIQFVNEIITVTSGYTATGIYIDFDDSTTLVSFANLTVNFSSNDTRRYTDETTLYTYNWTKTTDTSWEYYWSVNITHPDFDYDIIIFGILIPGRANITNYYRLNSTFTLILGRSPFRSVSDPTQYVSWVYVIISLVGLLIICSFSGFAGVPSIAGIALGIWLIACNYMISELPIAIGLVGTVILAFSLIYAYGGRKR